VTAKPPILDAEFTVIDGGWRPWRKTPRKLSGVAFWWREIWQTVVAYAVIFGGLTVIAYVSDWLTGH
jgi:hypothetical protein